MQSLLKAMNRDLQGLWIARLARDPLLVSGLLLPVWCVGACTYSIFNDSLHHPYICECFCRKPFYSPYIYAPYVRLTVNFHLQHEQDGRPLRSPLRATQILATDSFKREGNRTKRSGHYKLSPRQGYRHRKKEDRQLIFLHVREFHRTLSEVVSRSLLCTMPTGTPLRRTLSNTSASENLLPPCLFAVWQHGTHCHCGILKDCLPHC